MDRTHYRDSPPDGACGWHTIAQAIHRKNTSSLLNLYSTAGQQSGADILTTILEQKPPCSTDGRNAIKVAIPWIRRKHKQPRAFLSFENQLCCDDYTTFLDQHAATLFVQTSQQAMGGSIAMPRDPNREWLPLHSTSRNNRGDYDAYVTRFPIQQIQLIARGDLFAQLAGGHYSANLLEENGPHSL